MTNTVVETAYGAEAADRLEAAAEAGAAFQVSIEAGKDFPAALAFLRLASERGLAVTVTAEAKR